MPDASRLVAALSLAFLAFIVSGQIMPLMTEGMDFGWFTYVNVAIGLAIGWVVMGDRAGRGMTNAVNNGLTGMVVMVFWALFIQGGYEMMRRAMRNRYDGPLEAVAAIFQIGLDYAITIFVTHIVMTLIVGAILAGLATEYAWRQWR